MLLGVDVGVVHVKKANESGKNETRITHSHYYFLLCCDRSSEEAGAFVKKLQHLLRYIGASNANMEEVKRKKNNGTTTRF